MKRQESGVVRNAVVGKGIAGEGAAKLADFFLLVAGKDEPRAGHVFEEFEDQGSIFGKEDIRLTSLITEIEFLVEVREWIGMVRKSKILGCMQPGSCKSPCGFDTEVGGKSEDKENFNKS